jgi:uracil-DNA glycosylase
MPSRVQSTISSTASDALAEERFRAIFARAHAEHPSCLQDEWLTQPCRDALGRPVRPIVWSRRNGPWQRVSMLWVGAAPGNAGGKGRGSLGAHGTRIPFGGDIAGANLEVLLGSIGLDRNQTFIVGAFNSLPARGGGEPTPAELRSPVGDYGSSIDLLRDTIVATGAGLVVALGNVGLRTVAGAIAGIGADLPALARLERSGIARGTAFEVAALGGMSTTFDRAWSDAWSPSLPPRVVWLTHPSAQNMSPFARPETLFHQRMRETRRQLRRAARGSALPARRPPIPDNGIYALPEWRNEIAPRFARMDRLWRAHGV